MSAYGNLGSTRHYSIMLMLKKSYNAKPRRSNEIALNCTNLKRYVLHNKFIYFFVEIFIVTNHDTILYDT